LAHAHDRSARMQAFVSAAWSHLAPTGVSWLGFYERDPNDLSQLLLAAREPKPACSPIGMHGACGQCLLAAKPLVTRSSKLLARIFACKIEKPVFFNFTRGRHFLNTELKRKLFVRLRSLPNRHSELNSLEVHKECWERMTS
jgi:hypothetical protein